MLSALSALKIRHEKGFQVMAKVLVIEDVYSVRLKVELVLRNTGYTTTYSASSGEEAIQLACENPPDVIVMDIVMAGMDGIATLHRLRLLGITCPVIAYTARPEKMPGEFIEYGFNAYIPKAQSLSKLIGAIRDLMNKQTSRFSLTQCISYAS
jgi:CheY-like chemotaxis protein